MKPIENETYKEQFRHKLQIFEPKILDADSELYIISDNDFGAKLITANDNIEVRLNAGYVPNDAGRIEIRNAYPAVNSTVQLNLVTVDIDTGATLPPNTTIILDSLGVNGVNLHYSKTNSLWYVERLRAPFLSGLIAMDGNEVPLSAAAQIGEILVGSNMGAIAIPASNTAVSISSLELPPGQWEVTGWGGIAVVAGSVTNRRLIITGNINDINIPNLTAGVSMNDTDLVTATENWGVPLNRIYVFNDAPVTYHIAASVTKTTGTVTAIASLFARRIK